MKKISILGLHLNYGGVEKSIVSQANMLASDFEVELVITYKMNERLAFNIDPRVKIIYLTDKKPNREEFNKKLKSFRIIGAFIEGLKALRILFEKKNTMKKYIINSNSDIMISSRIEITELLNKYGKSYKIAEEHRHHNNDKKYIKKLKKATTNIDTLVCVSKELTEYYKNAFNRDNIVYIPNCLDSFPEETTTFDEKRLISVGRLSHEKGFLDLIDVFKIINEKDKTISLDLVGDGNERKLIEEKIKNLNLEKYITLHGYRDKEYINSLLSMSSCYLMCSFEESFGIVLIEAGSYAVPSIAFTSAQGAKELIEDGVSGYLIENRDKEKMADKVIELLEDSDKLKELGINAREKAKEFNFDKVKKQWLKLLEGRR